MQAQFLRERHNVLAALQSLHRLPAELVRITSHSFLCHLQFLSLHSVPFPSVSFLGFSPRLVSSSCRAPSRAILTGVCGSGKPTIERQLAPSPRSEPINFRGSLAPYSLLLVFG